jgi:hypothetical protein
MSGEEWHRNCEASWTCQGPCGREVCPRCEPSPGEFELCAECDWFSKDTPGDAA